MARGREAAGTAHLLTNIFGGSWRRAVSFLVLCSSPGPLVRSPLQAGAVPCDSETANQCPQLRFHKVLLWRGSEGSCGYNPLLGGSEMSGKELMETSVLPCNFSTCSTS